MSQRIVDREKKEKIDMDARTSEKIEKIKQCILSKKGEKIVILDLHELSSVADYFVITSGNSIPHIKALSNEIEKELDKQHMHYYTYSGTPESEWIVLDYADVVVHIFSDPKREYYSLEQIWNDAKIIE